MHKIVLLLLIGLFIKPCFSQFKFDESPTRLKGHRTSVGDVEFSPDGKKLATCGGKNQIIIFDVFNGSILASTPESGPAPINYIAYNKEGDLLASAGFTSGVQIWETKSLTKVGEIKGYSEFSDIIFSPIENTIAVCGGYENDNEHFVVSLHDAPSGKKIREFYKANASFSYATCIDFSADGKYIVVGFSNKEQGFRIWNAATGDLVKFIKHTDDITDITFSPDGKTVAGGGLDNTVYIWDVNTGKIVHKLIGLKDYVNTITFSPNGKYIAAAGNDSKTKFNMWQTDNGELIQSESAGGPDVNCLKFSPDGQALAIGLRTYGNAFDVATVLIYRTPEGTKSVPWFQFSSNQSKTSLEFPFEPTSNSQNKGSYTYHNVDLDNGSKIFSFYGVQYNFAVNDGQRNAAIQKRINFYAKDLTNIKKSTFTYNGYTGYDMVGYKGKVRYHYRFVFIGNIHYQYSLSSFSKNETSVEKRFMESFSIPGSANSDASSSNNSNQISTNHNSDGKSNFKVGDKIKGNWKGKGTYYHGTIARINGQKVYIQYDDGDVEWTTLQYIKAE